MNAVETQRNYGDWIAKYGRGEEPRRAVFLALLSMAIPPSERMQNRLEEAIHGLDDAGVAGMAAALDLCPDFEGTEGT